MSLFDELSPTLMSETVTVRARVGNSVNGKPVYGGDPIVFSRAQVSYQKLRFKPVGGAEEMLAAGRVVVGPTPVLGQDVELTLPDGTKPPVLGVQPRRLGGYQVIVFG